MKLLAFLGITLLLVSASTRAQGQASDSTNQTDAKKYCSNHYPKPCNMTHYRDWYRVGSYCIKYFKTPLNFGDAEFSCRDKAPGGHLVSVHSHWVNTAVFCTIWKSSRKEARTWIGGMDLFKTRKFSWTDGSSWDYKNWVPGQPDNTANMEDCVEMNWKNPGQWNDHKCQEKKSYVCAMKI